MQCYVLPFSIIEQVESLLFIFFVMCAILFKPACVCMSESVGESVPSCVHRGVQSSQGGSVTCPVGNLSCC